MFFTKSEKSGYYTEKYRHTSQTVTGRRSLLPSAGSILLVLVLFFTIYVNTIGLINIHYDDELDLILIMLTNL